MKKKTSVLVALISMCVIVTAGIGAVSASDETSGDHVNYVITVSYTHLTLPTNREV